MKNTYYTIFSLSHILPLVDHVRDIAHESVRGRRNQLAAVPAILNASLYGGYHYSVGQRIPIWEDIPYVTDKVKRGDIVYRYNGRELGCSKFSDYRQCLGIVTVDHVTNKTIIGTYGERVRPEQIICVARKDVNAK